MSCHAMPALSARRATLEDAEALLGIRRESETWLASRGIRQWPPGHFTMDRLRGELAAGSWLVLVDDVDRIHAGLESLESDELWPDAPPGEAHYIHGLMVDRRIAVPGAGGRLLDHAAARAHAAGASYLRLYCVATNPALRDYYLRRGFVETGHRDFEDSWFSARLFEKRV